MNFTGQYSVTEVRQRKSDGAKGRYVVLSPHHDTSGRNPDGCLELQVSDPDLVPEFTIGSVHTVTVSPMVSAVHPAIPAGPNVRDGVDEQGNVTRRGVDSQDGVDQGRDAQRDTRTSAGNDVNTGHNTNTNPQMSGPGQTGTPWQTGRSKY